MASEAEASCESDPNFAIICAFLEKFGETCGIDNIDFVELQQMLENNQEVSPELVNLHIKLLRKTKKKVTPERWERALINMCHSFSSKDAWEIERFGYKKTRLRIKLRALKELLEMQFDFNTKFKNDVNKMTAEELRSQPLGRDKLGRAYWFQTDNNYQVRIYKEDPDEETWNLIAKDREGLMSLITELTDGDSKLSSDSACNEDSNSLLEKPFIDTGQTDSSKENETNGEENGTEEETKLIKPVDDSDASKTSNFVAVHEDKASQDEGSNSEIDEKISPTEDLEDEEVKRPVLRIKSLSELMENSEEPNSTNEELTSSSNKKPKLELPEISIVMKPNLQKTLEEPDDDSSVIESPTMIIQGEGSGEDSQCGNIVVSDEIEDPVLYVYGIGSGKDCGMGNEKETLQTNSSSPSKSGNGESAHQLHGSQANNYKLGTIIDSKTDNKIFLPRDPNKKSRWDQKETEITEINPRPKEELLPKKPTFFFGPGSLNVKPSTILNSEAKKSTEVKPEQLNETSANEDETKSHINIVKDKEKATTSSVEDSTDKLEENINSKSRIDESSDPISIVNDDDFTLPIAKHNDENECDSENTVDDSSPKVPIIQKESDCSMEKIIKVPSPISTQEECNDTLEVDDGDISRGVSPVSFSDNNEENENGDANEEKESNENEVCESDNKESMEISETKVNFDDIGNIGNNVKVDTDENDNSKKEVVTEMDSNFSLAQTNEDTVPQSPIRKDSSENNVEDVSLIAPMEQDSSSIIEVANEENSLDDEGKMAKQEAVPPDSCKNEKINHNEITEKTDELKDEKIEEIDNGIVAENQESSKVEDKEVEKEEIQISQKPIENDTTSKDPLKKVGENSNECHVNEESKKQDDTNNAETSGRNTLRLTRQTRANKAALTVSAEPMKREGKSNKTETSPSQTSKSDEAESADSPVPLEAITIVDTDSNSAAGADNTETDPLAVSDEDRSNPAKPISSITNFSFDFNPSSPASDEPQNVRRNLRKRGREETKPEAGETSGKKPKMKGKRSIDLNLRKSVEEKRQQEVGDVSSDENESEVVAKKETKAKGGTKAQGKVKVGTSSLSDTDNASVKSQPSKKNTAAKNKRILKNLGLNEEDISAIAEAPPVPVRQSRRLAQLKIKEEACRRKLEDDEVSFKKKKKKDDDKVKKM